jgi:hypothetical protein
MVMPVAPMYGNGNGCGFGGDWSSWIILFLLFGMFNGNGWGGGFGGGMWGADGLYPWLNNSQNINGGFRDQMLNTSINEIQNSITSGFGDVQTALCGGFAGVNAGIAAAQNGITQQMYANQIADLERSFAAQTASTQGMNALQSQLAQCCCDNKAATADLKYTVATENCADRTQSMQNTRDIIDSQTRSTQAILDKLCALELDGVKSQLAQAQRENTGLQNQLNMATMQASQTAQTAQILAGQAAEIDGVYNRLKNCPVPSMPVYGNQPIFTCGNNGGCGCGCGTV